MWYVRIKLALAIITAGCAALSSAAVEPPTPAALSLPAPTPAPARIKLATLAPKGTSFHQVLLTMAEQWRSAPSGGVQLTIYPDGTMGGEADMVRRMRVGQIQAAMLTAIGLSEIERSIAGIQNIPMIYRSLDEVDYVREKLMPEFEKRFREKGFVILFSGDAGWVRFFAPRRAETPDDFKKMKMFAWSGDNVALDLWRKSGFQPVPLEFTDILTGLQTGMIESVTSTPSYALAGQFYTKTTYMLDLKWAPLLGATVITTAAWDALPNDTRAELMKSAAEAGVQIKARSRQENEESVEAMRKRGLNVIAVTPETEAIWRKMAEENYPKIRGSIVPDDMFDRVQQLLAEYRESGASGAKP